MGKSDTENININYQIIKAEWHISSLPNRKKELMGLLGAAGSFNTLIIFFSVIILLAVFCSEVSAAVAEAVGDTDEDSTVEERGAAVVVNVTDILNLDNS